MSKWFTKRLPQCLILIFSALGLLVTCSTAFAAQSDIQAELKSYAVVFNNGSFDEQRKQMSRLDWSGISDPVLFDIIAAKLSARAKQSTKAARQEASWYAKGLALSGNEKYRAQLEALASGADSKKVRKHAATALRRLDLYSVWNPIISKDVAQAPVGQLAEARVKNMLASDNPDVLRLGAKRLHHAHIEDKELLQLANQRLLRDYKNVNAEGIQIDALAWIIKALARSKDDQYKQTLSQIKETASNKKLKKFAKKHLATYAG